jgi:hypothetical protein
MIVFNLNTLVRIFGGVYKSQRALLVERMKFEIGSVLAIGRREV